MEHSDEIRYLTTKEWNSVSRQAKDERDKLILELLYATGCTVNELVNIKVSDIDFRLKKVHIRAANSRNHESRISYLSTELTWNIRDFLKVIKRFEDRQGYLLFTRQSSQMTTKRIRQLVQKYTLAAGIIGKNNPQILRYTHIVHAYMKNVPIAAIQKQVGLKKTRAIQIFSELQTKTTEKDYRKFLR